MSTLEPALLINGDWCCIVSNVNEAFIFLVRIFSGRIGVNSFKPINMIAVGVIEQSPETFYVQASIYSYDNLPWLLDINAIYTE